MEGKMKSFENLRVWQDTRKFVKSIYELTSSGISKGTLD